MNTLDNQLFQKVVDAVKNVPNQFKGCILEGFPNNIVPPFYSHISDPFLVSTTILDKTEPYPGAIFLYQL